MRIGICDDENIIRRELLNFCEEYKLLHINDIETVCFSSGEELLMCKQPIDILFLDIQMKGINGMKVAEKIREKDESMIIIFLTGYQGFMQEGYKVRAFRYLIKPLKHKEFNQVLSEAIHDLTKDSKAMVGTDGETVLFKIRDIIYIEYNNRNTIVRTKKDSYESTSTMMEWESILNTGDFFRVHKSYIVNMAYIEEIGKDVLLENGEKVELAIRQSGKLKKACREYRRRNAR